MTAISHIYESRHLAPYTLCIMPHTYQCIVGSKLRQSPRTDELRRAPTTALDRWEITCDEERRERRERKESKQGSKERWNEEN